MRFKFLETLLVPCVVIMGLLLASCMANGLHAADRAAILNNKLALQWMADGQHAWYKRQTSQEHSEYILVNMKQKNRTVAFDHDKMAQALSAVTKNKYDSRQLPIQQLDLLDNGETWLLSVAGKWFEGPVKTLALQASARGLQPPVSFEPRPSPQTDDETELTVINEYAQPIQLMWSDYQGKRKRYATLEKGEKTTQHTYVGHVWVAQDKSGTVLGVIEATSARSEVVIDGVGAPTPKPRKNPNQAPDNVWRIAVREHNYYLHPVAGGDPIALTTDGTEDNYYSLPVAWSPDSSHVIGMRIEKGDNRTITLISSSPKDQVQPTQRTVRYAKPGDKIDTKRVCLFRLADRKQIPVDDKFFTNPWSINSVAWMPDSSACTMMFNQRGHQVLRVVAVNRSGEARAIIDEQAPTFLDYANKLFYQLIPEQKSAIWMSERDGWNHLYRYDIETGQVKNQITKGNWVVRSVEHVDEEKQQIWFTAGGTVPGQDPYYIQHFRVQFDGSGLTALTDGDGSHAIEWSDTRRYLVDTWSRVDAPPQHALRDGNTGELIVFLEKADASQWLAAGGRMPERFVAKGRDGKTDIYGVIWRPFGFDEKKSYPVIENIYAGPHSAYVPKTFRTRYGQQKIADLGCVVAMIDGMGTSHRSKAFHDVCCKNIADAGFPDRIAWWKQAASTRPWMNLSRVGIYGGSAGGQNALGALLFHPDFYHVAVADCGCHDNRMDKIWWNELWMGWPIGPHYAEQSNVTNAHKLQGKLMLVVGELDDNVDPQSTHQVANALEKAGKDFELVVVHGAGHGAAETPFGSMKRAKFLKAHVVDYVKE